MNENMTIDMEKDQDNGQITYANEVVATIVNVATTEVEGISGIVGSNTISGILGKSKSSRSVGRGVRVDMDGNDVKVDVSVTVDYGMPIQKVGRNVQENIRKSIESMTGLHVEKVDLHVMGVSFEKENQEMQLSQSTPIVLEDDEEAVAEEQEEAAAQETVIVEEEAEEAAEEEAEAADEETADEEEAEVEEAEAAEEEADKE